MMTPRVVMPPMWLRGTLLLALMLIAGMGIGAFAMRSSTPRSTSHAMDPDALIRTLTRELALDSAQRTAIARVLDHHQAAIDSAWRTVQPSVRAAIDSSQMEIVYVLKPEQRTKFMTLLRQAHPGMVPPGR
jgi:hypothetical protein